MGGFLLRRRRGDSSKGLPGKLAQALLSTAPQREDKTPKGKVKSKNQVPFHHFL